MVICCVTVVAVTYSTDVGKQLVTKIEVVFIPVEGTVVSLLKFNTLLNVM